MNPLKLNFKTEILPILLVATAIISGFYFYTHFPAVVVSHWNFAGQPDGYSGKVSGAFAIPALISGMYLLFIFLPYLDPKGEKYQNFSKIYLLFRNLILLMLLIVYLASGAYNLGYYVNIQLIVPTLVGLLFIILGNYMGKIKSNWFVGVRTPWTMSSENVWNKTQSFGGKMMILFGLLIIITPLLPKILGIIVFVLGIIAVSFGSVIYSYLLYRKEKQAGLTK